MGESYHYNSQQPQKNHQQQARGLSRLGLRTSGGEIVQVQGGHIIRSTSRKDRHSKVCTAKGPRDRRVLLSAHTAIQFYDLQDRLGYDRPSKAVDWLIKKAQTAISKLAELPAWKPTATAGNLTNPNSTSVADFEINPDQLNHFEQHPDDSFVDNPLGNSQRSQDLRLSLQSFQDPVVHNHPHHHSQQTNNNNNNNIYFDGSGWSDNPSVGFQRVVAWGGDGGNNVSAGFVFSSPALAALSPPTPFLQPFPVPHLCFVLGSTRCRHSPGL
ncbi:hypothetical protein L1987_14691 [Smallanthus sonchifolius]|uniref:Uncharacterized protein n=1 Tax=Smallanthus sonchifolius TaxID=185202 RepID=A0ACB9J427_9ASTR|nr:hypothetical protein L1987_14691 [Smallanthus sonchifolius]